jgi:hypothetical protein
MTAQVSNTLANRILNAITGVSQTNYTLAGGANSKILVYSGAAPGIENAATGTLLGTFPLFSSTTSAALMTGASGGISQLVNAIPVAAAATGTAGYARFIDSNNAAVIEGTVGTTGSGADFIFDSLAFTSGQTATLQAASVKMPSNLGTVHISQTTLDALIDYIRINSAAPAMGASGIISIYSGSAPANAEIAPTGTLLAQFSTGTQGWATASSRTANLATPPLSVNAVNTGTAGYARWTKGIYTIQCGVGEAGSGADIILGSASFVNGVANTINDMSLMI